MLIYIYGTHLAPIDIHLVILYTIFHLFHLLFFAYYIYFETYWQLLLLIIHWICPLNCLIIHCSEFLQDAFGTQWMITNPYPKGAYTVSWAMGNLVFWIFSSSTLVLESIISFLVWCPFIAESSHLLCYKEYLHLNPHWSSYLISEHTD